MHTLVSFLMAVAPSVLLLYYYYHQNKYAPEPKGIIIKIFFIGTIYTLPVYSLECIISSVNTHFGFPRPASILFEAFVVAGLCEEYIKLRIVKKYAYKTPYFRSVYDGIMLTVTSSLGFACMENIVFVMSGTLATALNRGFTAVPMHAVCSGMMGYYIGRARFAKTKKEENALLSRGLWIAVLIHGTYDFLIMIAPFYGSAFSSLVIPLVVYFYLRLKRRVKQSLAETP